MRVHGGLFPRKLARPVAAQHASEESPPQQLGSHRRLGVAQMRPSSCSRARHDMGGRGWVGLLTWLMLHPSRRRTVQQQQPHTPKTQTQQKQFRVFCTV